MKQPSRTVIVVVAEILVFAALLAVIWLDEFVDLPHLLFGDPPTPYRLAEFVIETLACSIVGIATITGTLFILRRLDRVERFLRVCAACRKVSLGEEWVVFEEYLAKKLALRSSHGICPECFVKFNDETQTPASGRKRSS
jgi:hypothetical protein